MSDRLQYNPVGELDTQNSVLVDGGYSRESVHMHALEWNVLSTSLKSKSDKSILHRWTSPSEAWDVFLAWYGPHTTRAKSDLSRRLNSLKIAPGSNPLEEMGRIEDIAAEIRTAGLTLGDYMLYTIFIDVSPAEYEVEPRNLASRDNIGCDDIIKEVREQHHQLSGNRKKGSNAGHAGHAMFGGGGGGGRGKGGGGGGRGKGGAEGGHGKGGGHVNGKSGRRGQPGRGGKGTNEDDGGPAATAGGDGSSGRAAEGSIPEARCYRCGMKGHLKADCTGELCSRCHGRAHTADVSPLPMSGPRPRRSDAAVATDGGTLLISAPRRKKKLCWRCRNDDGDDGTVQASAFMAEDADECSNDLGRLEDRESAWQVGDEAWLCNRGTSTHMTPRADGMINYRECY